MSQERRNSASTLSSDLRLRHQLFPGSILLYASYWLFLWRTPGTEGDAPDPACLHCSRVGCQCVSCLRTREVQHKRENCHGGPAALLGASSEVTFPTGRERQVHQPSGRSPWMRKGTEWTAGSSSSLWSRAMWAGCRLNMGRNYPLALSFSKLELN